MTEIQISLGVASITVAGAALTGEAILKIQIDNDAVADLIAGSRPKRIQRSVALAKRFADIEPQELAQIVSAPVPEAQAKLGGVSPASVYRMRQQVNGRRPPKPRIPDLNKHLEKYGFDAARAVVRTAPTLEDAAAQLDIGATSIYKAMNILGVERPDRSDYRPDGWSKSGKRAATEAEIAPAQTAPEEELADKPKRKRIGRLDKHLAGFTDEDLRVIIGAAETLTEAAQFLGIGDSTIYSVLKRLGIDPKTKTWGNK